MSTRHRRRVALIVLAASLVAVPALALHWNPGFRRPDKWIPLNWSNVGNSDFRIAINYVYQNQYNTTDVHMNDVADWSAAEIRYVDAFYGDTGWAGQTDCMGWDGSRCAWARVKFNITYAPYDLWARRFLVCHETGHAIGLRHTSYTDSCMNLAWLANVLGGHDREEINLHY
jgi:hypothetical protein